MGKSKKRKHSSRSRERSRERSPDKLDKRLKLIEETLLVLVKDAENKRVGNNNTQSTPTRDERALSESCSGHSDGDIVAEGKSQNL